MSLRGWGGGDVSLCDRGLSVTFAILPILRLVAGCCAEGVEDGVLSLAALYN
jgi:hypothetical protein